MKILNLRYLMKRMRKSDGELKRLSLIATIGLASLSSYVFVFYEWLFNITKPSFSKRN